MARIGIVVPGGAAERSIMTMEDGSRRAVRLERGPVPGLGWE